MHAGMLLRPVLILALLAAIIYGIWEIRRWSMPLGQEVISAKQRYLRLWGLFLILAVLGLWLGGTYLPTPHTKLALIHWLQYWILTICLALPLIPLALLDWRENIRHLAESRQKLFQETLGPQAGLSTEPTKQTPA